MGFGPLNTPLKLSTPPFSTLATWCHVFHTPSFSTPVIWCRVFHSRVFHPCHLVPRFPLPRFQRPQQFLYTRVYYDLPSLISFGFSAFCVVFLQLLVISRPAEVGGWVGLSICSTCHLNAACRWPGRDVNWQRESYEPDLYHYNTCAFRTF